MMNWDIIGGDHLPKDITKCQHSYSVGHHQEIINCWEYCPQELHTCAMTLWILENVCGEHRPKTLLNVNVRTVLATVNQLLKVGNTSLKNYTPGPWHFEFKYYL